MKRGKLALVTAVIGSMLIASPFSPAHAEQPPQNGCVAVPKIQYDSAKKQNLLHNRFSTYVRTGRFLRRHYWYCQ
jgi:uncharacterized metal-binding protein YceD (DUF177 family)